MNNNKPNRKLNKKIKDNIKIPKFQIANNVTLRKDIEWTPEQLRVITSPSRNILVSASAGSGKTTVMIQRVLSLLAAGNSLSEMLIVTFTRAAAADMKEKLCRELSLSPDPALRKAIGALAEADISTLHSFCQRLISSYFYAVGADPEFTVLEENEADALLSRAIDKALETETDRADAAFADLCSIFGDSKDDKRLKKLIRAAYTQRSIRPEREESVISDQEYADMLRGELNAKRRNLIGKAQQLLALCREEGFNRNTAPLAELIRVLESSFKQPEYKAPKGIVPSQFQPLNEKFKVLKKQAQKLQKHFEDTGATGGQNAHYIEILNRLARGTADSYSALKRARGKLDFNDMEHYALMILRSASGAEIRAKYKFIFVDEYQDINPLQDTIISLLHGSDEDRGDNGRGGNSLFLVGDLKQSIYAFRGCEPAIFAKKRESFLANPECEVIELNANHRSCNGILRFANEVFESIMTGEFGNVDYAATGRFVMGQKENEGVKIHIVPKSGETAGGVYDIAAHETPLNAQAEQAASCIADILFNKSVEENGVKRPVLYSDIAVLVRSGGGTAAALCHRLSQAGIRAVCCGGLTYAESAEAETLMAYLKLVSNRLDDEALINSMRGYFGGFTDSELAAIRRTCPEAEFFYEAVEQYLVGNPCRINSAAVEKNDSCQSRAAGEETPCQNSPLAEENNFCRNSALKEKIQAFYAKLDGYRAMAAHAEAGELAGRIVSDAGFFQHAFTKGEAAAEALDKFLSWAEDNGTLGLYEFLKTAEGASFPSPQQAGDAVRIMTVHASKGLEFPFVLLLGAEKKFNLSDLNAPVLIREASMTMKCYDWKNRSVQPTAGWLYNRHKLNRRLLEEELRLLYVALTRAKYRLDIFAEGSLKDACAYPDPEEAGSWLSWLGPFCPALAQPLYPPMPGAPHSPAVMPPFSSSLAQKLQKRFAATAETSAAPPKVYVTALAAAANHSAGEESISIFAVEPDECFELDKASERDEFSGQSLKPDALSGANQPFKPLTTKVKPAGNPGVPNTDAETGTLYHKAMELIDFYGDFDTQWESMDCALTSHVKKEDIRLAAATLKKLCEGSKYYREQPFMLDIPAAEAGYGGAERLLLQGVIDLLIIRGEKCIIVDYKTGAVLPEHKKQLDYYAMAAQRILKLKVEDTLIYSFKQGKLFKV